MEDLLLYTDVDQMIKDEMGSQYPDSSRRLRAINTELKTLRSKYDIFTPRRVQDISVKTDGSTAYTLSSLIDDDDLDTILDLRPQDNTNTSYRFVKVDENKFQQDLDFNKRVNQFTLYYEDGEQKLKVMSTNFSSTAETIECVYLTRGIGQLSDGTNEAELTGASGEVIYLPYKYMDLVALGSMKRLWYQATGDESQTQMAITSNRYKGQLTKLGLSDDADMVKRGSKKVKMRGW